MRTGRCSCSMDEWWRSRCRVPGVRCRGTRSPSRIVRHPAPDTRHLAMDTLLADLRYALRGFRRSPAFVATVVLTIALGLGLNTSVFTIFDAYVLRPLAIRDAGSLFEVFFQDRRGRGKSLSWRQYQDLGARPTSAESFSHKSAFARSARG